MTIISNLIFLKRRSQKILLFDFLHVAQIYNNNFIFFFFLLFILKLFKVTQKMSRRRNTHYNFSYNLLSLYHFMNLFQIRKSNIISRVHEFRTRLDPTIFALFVAQRSC